MSDAINFLLDAAERTWGLFVAVAWGLWEWKRRKGRAARDKVDTIERLVKSVEDLSRKYDELLNANSSLRKEVSELKSELNEKQITIDRLRRRIDELEKPKQ
jgi:septal ring factor EnvC (AmiA/AmiB activator)